MLMAWGPYRFTIPNYSVESTGRSVQPRVEEQSIIGAPPTLHKLGPGLETISLESTFHPRHLNGRGLTQLAGVRQAVNAMLSLPLVHINGAGHNIFGNWVGMSLKDKQTIFDTNGTPQEVTVTMQLKPDLSVARNIARSAILSGSFSGSIGGISFGVSLDLGF